MEDAGFIIGSYLVTFLAVGALALAYVRSGKRLGERVPDEEKYWR